MSVIFSVPNKRPTTTTSVIVVKYPGAGLSDLSGTLVDAVSKQLLIKSAVVGRQLVYVCTCVNVVLAPFWLSSAAMMTPAQNIAVLENMRDKAAMRT